MAIGVAIQGIMIVLAPTVLIVAITVLAAGQDKLQLSWAVFATLIIVGVATALQAAKVGRLGGGHVLTTGVTPSFIALSVFALAEGGPAMLAGLIVLSSFSYLALASWLPQLRRIITPVVSGTVLMLIAAMVLPIAFDRLKEAPESAPLAAGPCVAAVTLAVATMLILRAPGIWRPWSLLIGIAAGCLAAAFGLYDFERLVAAPWVGIPESGFPGLNLIPSAGFWALLPMFLIFTLVQVIKSISDAVVAQQASRRRPRATDFRLIQGPIYANGVGILLSGLAGTPPSTSYSSLTVSLFNLTGVTVRSVGYVMGALLVVLAFFPRATGVLLAIPSPVMGGFLLVALGMLFVEGIQTLVRSGLDPQKAMVAGLAFSIGQGESPRLIVVARPESEAVELEFLAVFDEENLEDHLAYLNEQTEIYDERELSFRLLRHFASSVRHQKYHGLDIVTVRVNS